jgi:hypothetical protein
MSNPALFNCTLKEDPVLPDPVIDVSGDFAPTLPLEEEGTIVPLQGPEAKISRLSSERGGVSAGRFS